MLHTVIAALSVSPSWQVCSVTSYTFCSAVIDEICLIQSETQVKPFSEHSNGTEHGSGAGVLHRLLDELRSLLNEFKSESFLNHSQVMNISQLNFLVINSNLFFDFSFPFKVLRLRGFIRTSAMVALILCSSSYASLSLSSLSVTYE